MRLILNVNFLETTSKLSERTPGHKHVHVDSDTTHPCQLVINGRS